MNSNISNADITILRPRQVIELLNISKSTFWRLRNNPNIKFPLPILLSEKIIGWPLIEIRNWISSQQIKKL